MRYTVTGNQSPGKGTTGRKGLLKDIWKARGLYLAITPLFLGLLIFCYYPPIRGIFLSFMEWHVAGASRWVGLANFQSVINDPVLWQSCVTMLKLAGAGLLISLTVPCLVAEMIYALRNDRAKYWYRVLILLPVVVPGVVYLLIWQYIYQPTDGLLNNFLHLLGFFRGEWPNWLGDPKRVLTSLIFLGFPWVGGAQVLIYLAGLNNIPAGVRECAQLDGAGWWRRFICIDLPYLKGQLRFFVVTGVIAAFQDYGKQLVLTKGGPGYTSYVPGYYMYQVAFNFGDMGRACAIGTLLFLAVFTVTMISLRLIRAEEN